MSETFEVRDRRTRPRHALIWASDWDSDRFRRLSTAQRCVYVTLALYAQAGRGEVWPKQDSIATTTGLTTRSVGSAIKALVDLGYVEVSRQSSGPKRRNVYTLLTPNEDGP